MSFNRIVNKPLGVAFDLLIGNLNDVLDHTTDSCGRLLIEAAGKTKLVIANLKNAYCESLDKTALQAGEVAINVIRQCATVVEEIQKRNQNLLESGTNNLQQLLNTLPFANQRPQYTSMSPSCVILGSPVIFHFYGNFPQIGTPACIPRLSFNGQKARLINQKTSEFSFKISSQPLGLGELAVGCLEIPWQKSHPTMLTQQLVDTYKIPIGLLPQSPGNFIIERPTTQWERIERKRESLPITQNSGGSGKNYRCCNLEEKYTLETLPGWKIVPGSAQISELWRKGNPSIDGPHEDESSISCRIRTKYSFAGASDKLTFILSCMEYQETGVRGPPEIFHIPLKWGERKVLPYPLHTWKVKLKPFDGSPIREFVNSSAGDPFIRIEASPSNFAICTKEPKDVKWVRAVKVIDGGSSIIRVDEDESSVSDGEDEERCCRCMLDVASYASMFFLFFLIVGWIISPKKNPEGR